MNRRKRNDRQLKYTSLQCNCLSAQSIQKALLRIMHNKRNKEPAKGDFFAKLKPLPVRFVYLFTHCVMGAQYVRTKFVKHVNVTQILHFQKPDVL